MPNDPRDGIGIAIIGLAGYAPDEAALEGALGYLQAQGCRIHDYYRPQEKFQRFAATDDARLAQLEVAAADPDVQVVLALRGGYGLSRLLPKIDFRKMAASGKLFVGHSDFTPFHLGLLIAGGAMSFAGPMLCNDFTRDDLSDFTLQNFWRCLTGPTHTVAASAEGNPAVDIAGTLWGGNLSMLAHLAGTPYLPQIDNGILFVEDIAEHPYRIERMLLQLLYAGVLSRQKALILGNFSNYRLTEYDNGYDFDAMLVYLRETLPIPVLTGLPFGHMRDKATLVVGSQATLLSDGNSWELTMENYPNLADPHHP